MPGRSVNIRPWGVCDRCGQRYRHDTLRSEWTGALVCRPCWEPKHPQLTPPSNVGGDPRPVENARPRDNTLDVTIRRRVFTPTASVVTPRMALYSIVADVDAYTETGEITATGYTAGGQAMTGVTITANRLTADDTSWSGTIEAKSALIYDAGAGNATVALIDFGFTQSSSEGTFTVRCI